MSWEPEHIGAIPLVEPEEELARAAPDGPQLTSLGERLRERTQPLAPDDRTRGWAHAGLSEGMMAALDELASIFDPPEPIPPGAPLLHPDLAPAFALPWLAQIVGVRIPAGTSAEDARALIRGLGRYHTGTLEAFRAAAAFLLTGTRTVYFRERYGGNAYVIQIVTREDETPDPAGVLQLLLTQKPAGIVLDYHPITGWADYYALTDEGGTYAQLTGRFATYNDLRDNVRT